jgi:hypothetical protein
MYVLVENMTKYYLAYFYSKRNQKENINFRLQETCTDTKGVIRSHKSKNRQHNGQKKRDKRTNNDLQNTSQKTKD